MSISSGKVLHFNDETSRFKREKNALNSSASCLNVNGSIEFIKHTQYKHIHPQYSACASKKVIEI